MHVCVRRKAPKGFVPSGPKGRRRAKPGEESEAAKRPQLNPEPYRSPGQSLYGSNSFAPAMTTMSGRSVCSTSIVGP